jgi:hypothetical protein
VTGDTFWNKIQQDLGIPKDQVELLKSFDTTNREELVTNMLANYSFAIEINVAKDSYREPSQNYFRDPETGEEFGLQEDFGGSGYYSNLTVPGGTNYTENEIATPAITPNIKGHAQFATDQGIGWFRSDEASFIKQAMSIQNKEKDFEFAGSKYTQEYSLAKGFVHKKDGNIISEEEYRKAKYATPKTRRILEVQSDLFQKGRDRQDLADINKFKPLGLTKEEAIKAGKPENDFLQLLNQGSNWVTFFVKSIIQDSAKKGYNKVLFPKGDTASKIEGHTTLEQFRRQKENRIKELDEIIEKNKNLEIIEVVDSTGKYYRLRQKDTKTEMVGSYRTMESAETAISEKIFIKERDQLKQELERVEREGFGALKPIFNFYETTVANVLKKQGYSPKVVTDEYGNQWNEISIVPEREAQPILLQKKGTATATASPKVLKIVKQFIKDIGVDIKAVKNIVVDGQKMDADGAAMVMQKLIQVVEGKEAQALPEEAMHFVVEIIKQTNPKLYQQLLKEINGTKTLSEVFAQYGTDPNYQTKEGKPDVLKLKEEAIAKVLAQTIIKQAEGSIETTETKSKIQQWWDDILQWIKNLFARSGFDQVAMDIMAGKFEGTAEDIRVAEDRVFFQLSPQGRVINKLKEISSKIEKKEDGYYIDGKKIGRRVTDLVNDWYERRFRDRDLTKSDYQKAVDDLKAEKGTAGHKDIEYILSILVDENGKLKETPSDDSGYQSRLDRDNRDMYELLKANMIERLNSFPKGTVFLSETTVYDAKRGIAGTIDFLAIDPDGNTSVLDWKFMDINIDKYQEIPWYKVGSWRTQMEQYKQILQQVYGIQNQNFKQTRMIPIQAMYSKGNAKEDILPKLMGIKIGDVNVKNITEDFLIPVGLEAEKTGNPDVDRKIAELNTLYKKISEKKALPSERLSKNEQLNELFKAIRHLQMKTNVEPLIRQAKIFNKQVEKTVAVFAEKYEGKDPKSFTEKELNDYADDLMVMEDALETYASMYSDLESIFEGTLSEKDEKLQLDLRTASDTAGRLRRKVGDTLGKFTEDIIAKSVGVDNLLLPEKVIKGITRQFSSTATLQVKSIGVLYRKANAAFAKAGFETSNEVNKLAALKKAYDAWASGKGLSKKQYFNIIKKKDKNELIDEFNPEFYKTLKKKIEEKDFNWIRENIDVAAYNEFLREKQKEEFERIENKVRIGTDEEIAKEISNEKRNIQNLFNTSTAESPGWLLYDFVNKFPKRQTWESKEWKELNKAENKPAKDFYNYIREKNEEYRQIGYINARQARVFLPFVRKNMMERLITGGSINAVEQMMRDISIDEGDIGFGQTDPQTGRPISTIPRYFTKEVEGEMSTDLFRTMGLYNQFATKYKYLSDIEDQVRALVAIERNKKAIRTSFFGKSKYVDGKLDYVDHNDDNAQLVEDMMNAIVYGQKFLDSENFDMALGTMGKLGERLNEKIGRKIFPENLSGRQLSLNKIVNQLNNTFQITTLGFNPLSATSNLFGGNAQALINAGKYFTKADYASTEAIILMNKFGFADKKKMIALAQYFLPFTDDYNREYINKLSLNKLSQESLQDFLMVMMRNSDLNVQTMNFYSFLKNSIVLDGKVINAREYLREQPKYADRYKGSAAERKALEQEFEKDVEKLVEEKGVIKLAKLEDGVIEIPGVERSSESVIELRRKVQQLSKDAMGNLSEDDLRKINMTIYGKSFMVFKNWIPRLVDVRIGNLKYNWASDGYEWGRSRMVFRVLSEDLVGAIGNLRGILVANDRGVNFMRELYEKKKSEYETDTGKTLEMDENEFLDLVRQNTKSAALDLLFYAALWALYAGIKANMPDDDEDEATKNQWRYALKAVDKLRDEIGYFYDPSSAIKGFTRGLFPSLSLLDNATKTVKNFMLENYYIAVGDEELEEKNFVIKYAMKSVPFTNQASSWLPMFYPELAKDLGLRVQSKYGFR